MTTALSPSDRCKGERCKGCRRMSCPKKLDDRVSELVWKNQSLFLRAKDKAKLLQLILTLHTARFNLILVNHWSLTTSLFFSVPSSRNFSEASWPEAASSKRRTFKTTLLPSWRHLMSQLAGTLTDSTVQTWWRVTWSGISRTSPWKEMARKQRRPFKKSSTG